MRAFLLTARWWTLALLYGVLFGLASGAVWTLVLPDEPIRGWLIGALGGLAYGLVVGSIAARSHAKVRAVIGPVPADRYGEVLRAAWRGPVPARPEVREATVRLVGWRLEQAAGQQKGMMIATALFGTLAVVKAVTDSPWYWLPVAFWVAVIPARTGMRHHLRRRLALLERQEAVA